MTKERNCITRLVSGLNHLQRYNHVLALAGIQLESLVGNNDVSLHDIMELTEFVVLDENGNEHILFAELTAKQREYLGAHFTTAESLMKALAKQITAITAAVRVVLQTLDQALSVVPPAGIPFAKKAGKKNGSYGSIFQQPDSVCCLYDTDQCASNVTSATCTVGLMGTKQDCPCTGKGHGHKPRRKSHAKG